MATICENYSGVVIDQNHAPGESDFLAIESTWFYQSFRLPGNYRYGSSSDQFRYPSLSGLQLLVGVEDGASSIAELDFTLDYFILESGWSNLASGSVRGTHADGDKVWIDIYFPTPVEVSPTIAESLLRFGFQNQNAIEKVWFSQPNPITTGSALASDSLTPLQSPQHNRYSFCFRILGLTADSGTDFLGNPYRSIAVSATAENTSTTNGANSGYWLSAPQPSEFAVASMYFDVRPVPETEYGLTNLVQNPSFEADKEDFEIPFWWKEFGSSESFAFAVVDSWASRGKKSLLMEVEVPHGKNAGISSPTGTAGVRVFPNTTYVGSATVNATVFKSSTDVGLFFEWYDESGTVISSSEVGSVVTSVNKPTELVCVAETPPEAAFGALCIVAENHAGSGSAKNVRFMVDEIMWIQATENVPYFDGDSIDCVWSGQAGRSTSLQVLEGGPEENSSVVDSILLDPITPNVAFNVYYSEDGTADSNTTEEEWENKLWTRVPKSWVANQRQTYVFPEPISAKFIKIEFSRLQAQSYNPGPGQTPTTYKKFPKWVADFFIAQMEEPQFIANTVGVSYDALEFAYRYYLDDVREKPAAPIPAPGASSALLSKFFSTNVTEGVNQVDATTLSKINLALQTFSKPPAAQADPTTILGSRASAIALSSSNYPVEEPTTFDSSTLSEVSSLNRDNIVFDQNMPVMFFYLTCRHGYKKLAAEFASNVAYFAGVNEVAFIRNDYSTTADSETYIEAGRDTVNVEVNDFVIDENGRWVV